MNECKFCHDLKVIKVIREIWGEYDSKNGYEKMNYEFTVAIVERAWTKSKGKRNAGRTVHYRNQGIGFQLNYCPECGKEIK